jgi:hypothetical protein
MKFQLDPNRMIPRSCLEIQQEDAFTPEPSDETLTKLVAGQLQPGHRDYVYRLISRSVKWRTKFEQTLARQESH